MADCARLYEMEMIFSASVGFKEINDIMSQMGCNDKLQIKDALKFSIKQVLPAIPDEEYLQKVADVIKEEYQNGQYNITECHFEGYKYLREKRCNNA